MYHDNVYKCTCKKFKTEFVYPKGHNWEGLTPEQVNEGYKNHSPSEMADGKSLEAVSGGDSPRKIETKPAVSSGKEVEDTLSSKKINLGYCYAYKQPDIKDFIQKLKANDEGYRVVSFEKIDKLAGKQLSGAELGAELT